MQWRHSDKHNFHSTHIQMTDKLEDVIQIAPSTQRPINSVDRVKSLTSIPKNVSLTHHWLWCHRKRNYEWMLIMLIRNHTKNSVTFAFPSTFLLNGRFVCFEFFLFFVFLSKNGKSFAKISYKGMPFDGRDGNNGKLQGDLWNDKIKTAIETRPMPTFKYVDDVVYDRCGW